MSESYITSLHIEKLGHKIEEIRIRALNHIISKLDHINAPEISFSKYLDMLKKLFDWFDFHPIFEEEKVLKLIHRILTSNISESIIKYIDSFTLVRDLNQIKLKVSQKSQLIIDKIIDDIESVHHIQKSDLNLISDVPLSYRSDQSNKISESSEKFFNTPATSITGTEKKSPLLSTIRKPAKVENYTLSSSISVTRDYLYESIPFVTLKWQKLVESDYHVLKSVEDSLHSPPDPSVLLNSCDFFCHVILKDFPAEVFLQRPKILLLFYDMVKNSPSTRITNAALVCLNKLTANLITRILFYSDPSTFTTKDDDSFISEASNKSSLVSRSIFSYNSEICKLKTGNLEVDNVYDQKTLPQFCVDTFICVLTYLSEKPISFRDSVNRKKTQSGINYALKLVSRLVTLVNLCIKPTIWNIPNDVSDVCKHIIEVMNLYGNVLEQYRLMVAATDMEYFERMAQLYLLHCVSNLLNKLIPISKCNSIIPRSLKNALSTSLLDASFGKLFPRTHESLVQIVNEFKGQSEIESLVKYNDVKNVCNAMTKAVQILKHESFPETIESLKIIKESLASFEFHKNLVIINTFLKICVKNHVQLSSNRSSLELAGDILVNFLSHSDEDIKQETYSLCHKLVTNIIGINHTKHMSETDPGSQILFLFKPEIFIEISAHGLTSNSIQIQTQAEDILIHTLKCKLIVSEKVWLKLILNLMPAMPILQCFTDNKTPLGKTILKIFDPDISASLHISQIDVLKGNLRLLFCKEAFLRNEAVSRLCWLVSTDDNSDKKLPKIKTLDDRGLCNVFQLHFQIDLNRKRSSKQFYEASSLRQVTELLAMKEVEPVIRRSALTQICVMLEDFYLQSSFLNDNGLQLILDILDNSLYEKHYENYPDSAIPIVTILKNICLFNSVIRQELSVNTKLIFNLSRALLLYSTDKRFQSDAAILFCLLLFSDYSIYSVNTSDFADFSLPEVVVEKLHMPFKCNVHWKISRHTKPALFEYLMMDNWCKTTLRMHWNIEYFGGISKLMNWTFIPTISDLTNEELSEFSSDLRLTKFDLLALKSSSINNCCQQFLYDIENAITHQSVFEAVRGIIGYIELWCLSTYPESLINGDLLELPWESAFCRFLSAPPVNSEDATLLIEILRCLTLLLNVYKNSEHSCWIMLIFQKPGHYLPKLLQIDIKNDLRPISLQLLKLISKTAILEQSLLDNEILNEDEEIKNNNKIFNWSYIIGLIVENLKFGDTEQFYNLAYLDKLLSCLVQITSNLGWSQTCISNKIFSELIEALTELLSTFHYGKGAEASNSFMGLNIIRNTLMTLNHILYEMQNFHKKTWESFWVNEIICKSAIFNLSSLWSCRDVVIRAATLQLISGLAISSRGASVIVTNIRQRSDNIWNTTLKILLDNTESSIVRENAGYLLANLASHATLAATGEVNFPLCHAPLNPNKEMSATDSVLLLLKQCNFYKELVDILNGIHLQDSLEVKPRKSDIFSKTYSQTSSEISDSSNEEVSVYVTPGLIKSVSSFIENLIFLSPENVTKSLNQHGLIREFFRCLFTPSFDLSDNKKFLHYTDTLEMNTVVCSVLSRCILANKSCKIVILHCKDSLFTLLSLLNPDLYNTEKHHYLYLRNQLWNEIFKLLSVVLDNENADTAKEVFSAISTVLVENDENTFFKSVYESINSKNTNLQKSALNSLTSLLTIDTIVSPRSLKSSSSSSIQILLDNSKSPHNSVTKIQNTVGNDLCQMLIKLLDYHLMEGVNKDNKKKMAVFGALSSLLYASEEAKKCALNEGLLTNVVNQLKSLHIDISLHSLDNYRKISEKRKVNPILKEVDSLFCMLNNFIVGNEPAKNLASELYLADIIHKYWVWFNFERNILEHLLRFLCTFTTNCPQACQSLNLTNALPGTGPRRSATNLSLLNALVNLIAKEMELISRSHDTKILQLSFVILKNVSSVTECRILLSKSTLFNCLNRLHPGFTKKQKYWEPIECMWLEFLEVFSFYPEGQLHLTKTNDILDLLITLVTNLKNSNKVIALSVLRNISFHQTNRFRMLASMEFIQMMHEKLSNGSIQEKNIIVSMIWALVANSQRSKMAIKCAGLDTKIQDLLKQYELQENYDKSYQTMVYVLSILRDGEKQT